MKMMIKGSQSKISAYYKYLTNSSQFSRPLSTVVESKDASNVKIDSEWDTARPYKSIPGPSKIALIRGFAPGGKYHDLPIIHMHRAMRNDYGDLVRLPGLFGRGDTLLAYKPSIFEKIYRTESQHPKRRGLETFVYYRKKVRPDIFGDMGGLLSEDGEKWLNLRSTVNPVMLQPKAVKKYGDKVEEIAFEFIDKIRQIRNKETMEMPDNFGHELNCWALETIGVVALDDRLGVLHNTDGSRGQAIIQNVKDFFILAYELDVALSFWKLYKTPKFYKLMNVFEEMTQTIMFYVDKAVARLDSMDQSNRDNDDKSVLEKLLLIDRRIAIIMAFDMILAGVDTTSSSLVSCLYHLSKNPDKQERLRKEVFKNLPNKTSKLTMECLNNMPYMRAVFKEAIRLNPVLAGNGRMTGRDVVLDGYQVPGGTEVALATVCLQNDPEYYPKTSDFIPERYIKGDPLYEESKSLCNTSFIDLPFGFGPRSCIGRRFAEMEVFTILSRMLREFKVEYHYGPLKYKTSIVLSPQEDLKFKFIDIDQ